MPKSYTYSSGDSMSIRYSDLCMYYFCVTTAIRLDSNNIDLLEQKANLLLDLEEHKKALDCFEIMLKVRACVRGHLMSLCICKFVHEFVHVAFR